MTAGAIDLGEKPSVVSAIVKYHVTGRACLVVNDAMDVLGGKGICLGPNNFMGRAYQQIPVAITVEGAKYPDPQPDHLRPGAIRCHPRAEGDGRRPRRGPGPLPARLRHALFNHLASSGRGFARGWPASPVPASGPCSQRGAGDPPLPPAASRFGRRPSPSSPTSDVRSWAAT